MAEKHLIAFALGKFLEGLADGMKTGMTVANERNKEDRLEEILRQRELRQTVKDAFQLNTTMAKIAAEQERHEEAARHRRVTEAQAEARIAGEQASRRETARHHRAIEAQTRERAKLTAAKEAAKPQFTIETITELKPKRVPVSDIALLYNQIPPAPRGFFSDTTAYRPIFKTRFRQALDADPVYRNLPDESRSNLVNRAFDLLEQNNWDVSKVPKDSNITINVPTKVVKRIPASIAAAAAIDRPVEGRFQTGTVIHLKGVPYYVERGGDSPSDVILSTLEDAKKRGLITEGQAKELLVSEEEEEEEEE